MDDTEWMKRAACIGADPRIFDPSTSKSKSGGTVWREICDACPVRMHCIDYAIKNDVEGYWGSTPLERSIFKSLGHQATDPSPGSLLQGSFGLYEDEDFALSLEIPEFSPYPTGESEDYWEHVRPRTDSTVQESIQALDDVLEFLSDLL